MLVQHQELFSHLTPTSSWKQNTVLAADFLSCLSVPWTRRTGLSGQARSHIQWKKLLCTQLSSIQLTRISLFLKRKSYFGTNVCRMCRLNGFNASCVIENGSKTMQTKEVCMMVHFFSARIPVHLVASWSVSALKCAACLCAKASTRSPTNTPIQPAMRNHHLRDELNINKPKILKRGHLEPGDCISIDQYVSTVQSRLLWTFGCERDGYKCGTLFVDHASRKIYNFCQLSNNANETISSKSDLEALACEELVIIKKFHTYNGIFASAAFK